MPTLFTRIIAGDLPARFVWKDDIAVAFTTIAPLRPGHTLIVPRAEVDHWLDLDPAVAAHCFEVARKIGLGVQAAFRPVKVGLMIAGLEVPHVHLHVIPVYTMDDLNPANQDKNARAQELDHAAAELRAALRALSFTEASD